MSEVDYEGYQATAQQDIDDYLALYRENGSDPSKTPLSIPPQLWDENTWALYAGPLQTDTRAPYYQDENGENQITIPAMPEYELYQEPRLFQRYNHKAYDDFILIAAGVPDPSGAYMLPYNLVNEWYDPETGDVFDPYSGGRWHHEHPNAVYGLVGKPCVNIFDIVNDFIHDAPDEEGQNYLRNFNLETGSLRSNPAGWPEAYRTPFYEGHPGYVWTGEDVVEPKPYTGWE